MASSPPPPLQSPTSIPPRTSSANQTTHPSIPSSPTSTSISASISASTSRHRSTSNGSGEWLANRIPPPPLLLQSITPGAVSPVPSIPPTAHLIHQRHSSSSSTPIPGMASHHHSAAVSQGGSSAATPPSATPNSAPQPPPDPSRYRDADLDFTTYRKTWTEDKDRIVRGPFDYLNDQPGKDFRTRLITSFDAWLEVPPESLAIITRVVDMLHTASLLIDDVEDGSSLRRGLPVAHSIFGIPQTINSANYVYFLALQELLRLENPRAVAIFSEELVSLHRGQGMDLFWRDTLSCPTEEDYLEMVGNKTGGLFRLGIKLMQAESPHPESDIDCVPLVNAVGLIFQIRDDLMNLSSATYSTNKGMCEDLTEGKFSFPIIHSIRADPTCMQLISILGQKTTDVDVKRYAVAYMQGTGSFEYTKKVLAVLVERARKMVDDVDGGRGRSAGLHAILDWASD